MSIPDGTGAQPTAGGPPVLEGRRVALRPLVLADYENLRLIELSNTLLGGYRHRGQTPSPENYANRLWAGVVAQFIIVSKANSQPIGAVACFDPDYRNGHAELGGMVFPSLKNAAWPLEGVRLFVDYLFHAFPFRKLYGHSLAPVADQFASAFGAVAKVEGRLSDHEYLNGEYVDMVIFALSRDAWFSDRNPYRQSKLLNHLTRLQGACHHGE